MGKAKRAEAKILVIDDEPDITDIVREFLETENYEVVCLNSTQFWFEQFSAFQPDLILLDISMPGEDGYAVCSQLKADPSSADVPVVFLTGKDKDEDQGRSFKAGADMFIKKPFSGDRLLGIVQIVLASSKVRPNRT
jgi:two-component system, OmpR family, phosphate regulon response regulator PhoB